MKNRAQWSWAAYDWANSAFATTVIAGFFPVFFKQYNAAGMEATQSTFLVGCVQFGRQRGGDVGSAVSRHAGRPARRP